jgi:anti-sigma factor RsiW
MRRRIEHMRYRRYLDAHVDGELDAELAGRVADHVENCPMCTGAANTTAVVKHRLSLRRLLPSHTAHRVRREEH